MSALAAPAWEERAAAYAAGSAVEHFAWWCETYCVQSVDEFAGQPLILEPWQTDFFGEALAVDDHERPVWGIVGLLVPRKNGKTTMLAAYALYHLLGDTGKPRVRLAAASKEQAGELFTSLVDFIRANPHVERLVRIREFHKEVVRADNKPGFIKTVACSGGRLHGGNDSLVICDELAQWHTQSARAAWTALTTGGGARPKAQIFTITTAGDAATRDSSILGRLVDGNEANGQVEEPDAALTISRNPVTRTLVYNYSTPVDDLAKPEDALNDADRVKLANPSSWVTAAFIATQAARTDISRGELLQYYANVWADTEDAFCTRSRWRHLGDGDPLADGRTVCLGADGSRTYDTTAIGWASFAPDGRCDVGAWVLSARRDAPHHELSPGGEIDFDLVEHELEACTRRWRVVDAAYDPRYLDRSAQVLRRRIGARIVPVEPTSRHYDDAIAALDRGIIDGIVRTDGDAVLAEHVAACRKVVRNGRVKLYKKDDAKPIDAVPAIALAYWRAVVRQTRRSVLY